MSSAETTNQQNLKKSISTPAAIGVAFNQTVGGGIVALTGVAIGITGGGVSIAFVIAIITVFIGSLPMAAIGSAMPAVGGMYTYTARLIHPFAGYGALFVSFLAQSSLGLYGITAGQYMHALNPAFNETAVAVILIVGFYLANMMGAAFGSRAGIVMSFLMIAGFAIFIIMGLGSVDWANYPPMLPAGFNGLLQAAALLTFATGGAAVVVELGGELKNPGRAIPIAMIGGTAIAGVMYVLIAIVAAGVLPIAEVANQPLSVVGAEFLPPVAWGFFILGGAMVAVISTMNTQMLSGTKSLLAAIDDGWFPKGLGAVNKRFGTPHWLLTILLILGLAPVLFEVPLDVLASAISGIAMLTSVFVLSASLRLRYVRPDLHQKAVFKLPVGLHWGLVIAAVSISIYQSQLLLKNGVPANILIIVAVIAAIALIWAIIRYPKVKRVLAARQINTGSTWIDLGDGNTIVGTEVPEDEDDNISDAEKALA